MDLRWFYCFIRTVISVRPFRTRSSLKAIGAVIPQGMFAPFNYKGEAAKQYA